METKTRRYDPLSINREILTLEMAPYSCGWRLSLISMVFRSELNNLL